MSKTSFDLEQSLSEAVSYIKKRISQKPPIGVILGSGLGDFAEKLQNSKKIPAAEVPGFPTSTVEGHKGILVFGELGNLPVVAIQGRTHFYEGYPIGQVAYVVRVMGLLGVKKLLVTNAAGSTNPHFLPGDLMIITDHINSLFQNPLIGTVVSSEARFPDMFNSYHPAYIDLIENIALKLQIPIRKGVLWVSSGPSYETAAEIRMIRKLGADAVSMSTVPEVLAARARGIEVAGISCITNFATGLSCMPLSHQEVTQVAGKVKPKFQALLHELLIQMDSI